MIELITELSKLSPIHIFAYITAIAFLCYITERLIPLRSVSKDQWEWNNRPARKFPGIASLGWKQVLFFTIIGVGIGGLFRLIVGFLPPKRLSQVLAGGIQTNMALGNTMMFNSEISSEVYAASWLNNRKINSSPMHTLILLRIMLRRLSRRYYIFFLFACVGLLSFSLYPINPPYIHFLCLIGWGVLASAVWRATNIQAKNSLPWRLSILCCITVAGISLMLAIFPSHHSIATNFWAMVTIFYIAIVRGKPREISDFTVFDVGVVSIPPGMFSYWLSGFLGIIPAIFATVSSTLF